jgi:hypothetical protein
VRLTDPATPRSGGRRTAAAVLRLLACAAVLTAITMFWLGQRAHAYGERMLSRFGEHMLRYAGANHQSKPEEIGVNGAAFFLSTGAVDASVSEVLDQFQAKCTKKNGQLHEQWAALSKRRHTELNPYSALWDGVFRGGGRTNGVVACAETGDGPLPPEQLITRIKAVLATGDLAKLGGLRYVYAARDGVRTMFVAVWNEGALNFRQMFPAHGDAPGSDPVGIPRPKDTRRVLSTQPVGSKATLNVYEASQQHAVELGNFYAQQLPAAGFTLLTKKHRFMAAHDGQRMVTISIQDDSRTGHGVATIATQPD